MGLGQIAQAARRLYRPRLQLIMALKASPCCFSADIWTSYLGKTMPDLRTDLETTLHLDMLRAFQRSRASLPIRLYRAMKRELAPSVYGLNWGDPDTVEPLRFIRDRYVMPYVRSDQTGLEIGPGGGRWTRYLIGFRKLHVVDYYDEMLHELRKNFSTPNMVFIRNNGMDFPGVEDHSIDYLFSFDAFVHLDVPIIEGYLKNMKRLLKPGSNVVLHYSDKTKVMAQYEGFSDNNPAMMRRLVTENGYKILEEDLTSMWHSAVVRFTL
jgi:SAM-dependent methyltransferase